MPRFRTTIPSTLPAAEAFAYMAEFDHCRDWDDSVSEARRLDDGPLKVGSAFHVVARFAGRSLPLRYEISELDEPSRVVLVARQKLFTGRDHIAVEPTEAGSRVTYEAVLEMHGAARLLAPLVGVLFNRTCRAAQANLQRVLSA